MRLDLVERRAQGLLDLGRHDAVATALPALAAEHPFRERLWALLALALYRCDRDLVRGAYPPRAACAFSLRPASLYRDELGVVALPGLTSPTTTGSRPPPPGPRSR